MERLYRDVDSDKLHPDVRNVVAVLKRAIHEHHPEMQHVQITLDQVHVSDVAPRFDYVGTEQVRKVNK